MGPAEAETRQEYVVEALKAARRIHRTVLALSLACLVLGISRPRGHEGALREISALVAYDPVRAAHVVDSLDAARARTEARLLETLGSSPLAGTGADLRVVCGGKPDGAIWWGGLRDRSLDEIAATGLQPFRWKWFQPDSLGLVALLDTLALAGCPRTLRKATLSFKEWPQPGRALGLATFEFSDGEGVQQCRPPGWRHPVEVHWLQANIAGEVLQGEWRPLEWLRSQPGSRTLLDDQGRLLPRLQDHPNWEEWRGLNAVEALEAISEAAAPPSERMDVLGLHMKADQARRIVPGLLAALVTVMWTYVRSAGRRRPPTGVPAWIPWEPLMSGPTARLVDLASVVLAVIAVVSVLDPLWAAAASLWICCFWFLCQVEFHGLRAEVREDRSRRAEPRS